MSRGLHLFYQNLRLRDNPSLIQACHHNELLCLYILDSAHSMGSASKLWLHKSLCSLYAELKEHGMELVFASGSFVKVVLDYVKSHHISHVYFDQPIDMNMNSLGKELESLGVKLYLFRHSLLFDFSKIFAKNGSPYQVFTPFYKACLKENTPSVPCGIPRVWPKTIKAKSLKLENLNLVSLTWDLKGDFEPGEKGAQRALKYFKTHKIDEYSKTRDYPAQEGTSRLSPHLHFGELSPYQVYHHVLDESYRRQLIWREFAHYLLLHFPQIIRGPLKEVYKKFPWKKNESFLKQWQEGKTGIPIVDAGMRQLWQTGWMHNRVRMIVASFLVKDLLISWQEGAAWFWDTLVDADLANNIFGWQWIAGCGADAAPYFRVFNPYIQSMKFDPEGAYIKTYVPELKNLDKSMIHEPHKEDQSSLKKAGIVLGEDYPWPMVDHDAARQKALKLYYEWKT